MTKKERKIKKANMLKNKKLVKRYPWLAPKDWSEQHIRKDYDYSWTYLDWLPQGWHRAFGDLICEDIQKELEQLGAVQDYSICEIKSKFGELRWYDNYCLHTIEDDYTHISRHICESCGKPDVPMLNFGWLSPLCKSCYEMHISSTKSYEDIIVEDGPIPDEYIVIVNGEETIHNIKNLADRIRKKWEKIRKLKKEN